MNFTKATSQLRKENFTDGQITCFVVTLTHAMTLLNEDDPIDNKRSYGEEVKNKARETLWEENEDDVEMGIRIFDVFHDFQIQSSLGGLGGTKPQTFRELMDKKLTNSEN